MTVFDAYAAYYDLLYRDKAYGEEAGYVLGLLADHGVRAGSLLELGCGTGRHAEHFANSGFEIHGIDLSPAMVEQAARRFETAASRHRFEVGDIRTVRLQREFDAVVSMFHVFSYQSTNDDLDRAFQTAALHLRQGGVFVFDFWYGPGVLTDRPAVRVREMSDDRIDLVRIAEPRFLPNENCVDVHYRVLLTDRSTGHAHRFEETHRMRYLFLPEIVQMAGVHRLEIAAAYAGQTRQAPGFDAWTGTAVAIRK